MVVYPNFPCLTLHLDIENLSSKKKKFKEYIKGFFTLIILTLIFVFYSNFAF